MIPDREKFTEHMKRAEEISREVSREVERQAVQFTKKMPKRLMPQWAWAVVVGIFICIFLFLGMLAAWASVVSIPSIDNFENRQVAESTKIYDRTGNVVLYDVHGNVRRTAIPLSEISPYVQKASVAIEDAEFYTHHGVRPLAILRAVWTDITTGHAKEGGSTITQQVVKNALLTTDKTIVRKLKEIILAIRLERLYSKDKILETYLNENGYGGTVYGVQEAAQYFFGVDAKDVDLAQGAYLAAIPQAPTHLSPYGTHRDELDQRKNLVLQRMKESGFITQSEYDQAHSEMVQFKDELTAGIKAPHFVFYVRDYLENKYSADVVEKGGLRVITTLDYDLQQKGEEIVKTYAKKNEKNFNASNAGLVAIDPKTGQILTMVGSRDYFDKTIDGMVNVTTSERQPGSSFKPFVYATAFEKGYTPDTVVFDLQTQFSTACDAQDVASDTPPCYSPSNYDGTFKGPLKLRDALAISENIPAIKVLYLAGIQDSIKTAQDLGITTLGNADRYGLTLVLGGGEVNLVEMTGAYSVFANDGVRNPPTAILRVEDKDGTILENFENKSVQVIDPQIARLMNDVLSDNNARIPEFGADSPLYFKGYDVADKTGTTNDFRDTWIIGYTPSFAAGSWAGNNDNSPMVKKIAAFIVAPMWHEFMTYALQKYSSPSDAFTRPAPEPNPDELPPVLRGEWNANPAQGVHDILYWLRKEAPRSGQPGNTNDSQFTRWDYPVQLWAAAGGIPVTLPTTSSLQPGPASSVSPFSITEPQVGTFVRWGYPFTASVSFPSSLQVSSVAYYLNGQLVGTATSPPFSIQLFPKDRGPAILRAVASGGTSAESSVAITIQ